MKYDNAKINIRKNYITFIKITKLTQQNNQKCK